MFRPMITSLALLGTIFLVACGGRSGVGVGEFSSDNAGSGGAAQGVGGATASGPAASGAGGASGSGNVTATNGASATSGVGAGTTVGSGAAVGSSSGAATSTSSTASGGPIDCFQCIGQNCPSALQCLQDPACMQGAMCAFTQCLGGGQPDFGCLLTCFNGDFSAAIQAFQAVTCVMGQCQNECGNLIGGGSGGGTPPGG
jgi:hypothetical protein